MKWTIAIALLALTACNKEPEVKLKNATVEQIAQEVQNKGGPQVKLEPGQWQIDTTMNLVDVEGVPDAAKAQMKSAMGRTATVSQCLTPADVEKPNVFAGKENSRCTYDSFEMKGGKLKAQMHCPGQSGAEMVMTMDGSYSSRSYQVKATMDMKMPGSGQRMKMTMDSTGKRAGECAAAPKAS